MTEKNVLPKREQTVHNISYFNKKEKFTIRRKQKMIGSKTQEINIYWKDSKDKLFAVMNNFIM